MSRIPVEVGSLHAAGAKTAGDSLIGDFTLRPEFTSAELRVSFGNNPLGSAAGIQLHASTDSWATETVNAVKALGTLEPGEVDSGGVLVMAKAGGLQLVYRLSVSANTTVDVLGVDAFYEGGG